MDRFPPNVKGPLEERRDASLHCQSAQPALRRLRERRSEGPARSVEAACDEAPHPVGPAPPAWSPPLGRPKTRLAQSQRWICLAGLFRLEPRSVRVGVEEVELPWWGAALSVSCVESRSGGLSTFRAPYSSRSIERRKTSVLVSLLLLLSISPRFESLD